MRISDYWDREKGNNLASKGWCPIWHLPTPPQACPAALTRCPGQRTGTASIRYVWWERSGANLFCGGPCHNKESLDFILWGAPRILSKNGMVSLGWKREFWKQSLYAPPPSISLSAILPSPYWVNAFRVKATSNLVIISTMKNNCLWWKRWHSGGVRCPFEKPCQGSVFVI